MSGLFATVTAEYDGSTFSHRVEWGGPVPRNPLHTFNLAADEAVGFVRDALAGRTSSKSPVLPGSPLSDHEKLREIQKIFDDVKDFPGYVDSIPKIQKVLNR